jgi:integrase
VLVDSGHDPQGVVLAGRAAPTMAELCRRFLEEHATLRRASTAAGCESAIANYIRPELGAHKVDDVTYADVQKLHRKITKLGRPYRANRIVAQLSKMFSLAIRWGMRTDNLNPCRGIERNQEHKRVRYLSPDELGRLTKALADHQDRQGVAVIRLLLLTGARKGEVLAMRWDDIQEGVWVKPGHTTKQRTEHRVPLSAPAKLLISELEQKSEHVFPGHGKLPHRAGIQRTWAELCDAAGIKGCRVHDLRHTHASLLASSGHSLALIGSLLGHASPVTTHRYAHLLDEPLRVAVEKVGRMVAGAGTAKKKIGKVVPIR